MSKILSNEEILVLAPAVFGDKAAQNVTEQYNHMSSEKILYKMKEHGWVPVKVQQKKTHSKTTDGLQKHMVRFRQIENAVPSAMLTECPEIIMVNSHDRTASLKLHVGCFRFACLNGLIIGEKLMKSLKAIHRGEHNTELSVLTCVDTILEQFPVVLGMIDTLKGHEMKPEEQKRLAELVMFEQWGNNPDLHPVSAETLLAVKRDADKGNDLWTVLNRIQEKVVKGGLKEHGRLNKISGKLFNKTKEIKNIDNNVGINKFIFDAADRFMRGEFPELPKIEVGESALVVA